MAGSLHATCCTSCCSLSQSIYLLIPPPNHAISPTNNAAMFTLQTVSTFLGLKPSDPPVPILLTLELNAVMEATPPPSHYHPYHTQDRQTTGKVSDILPTRGRRHAPQPPPSR